MKTRNERQTIPTAKTVFVQGQGGRYPEVKRCGYCDRLVRWTLQEGRNVAVNCDGSRHQCLTDGTAKRRQPVKHARPLPYEVAVFFASRQVVTCKEQPVQTGQSSRELSRDDEIKAMHKANIAAWKTQTEAIIQLADAMLKVAQSNNAVADSNRRLAKTYGRLARAMERGRWPQR